MNPTEAAAHAELQTALIYGSIVVLLILGGFIWWLNYSYKQRNKRNRSPHLELVKPAPKVRGRRRHKKHGK
ncbi:MAG: hypothetical protein V4724_00125 [Pseudomonadota bacterium]